MKHLPDPPKTPVIEGYTDNALVSGETVNLSCHSEGGVPPPKLEWYNGENLLDDSFSIANNFVINELSLKVTAEEDNAIIECRVYNGVGDFPPSATVKLSVLCKLK